MGNVMARDRNFHGFICKELILEIIVMKKVVRGGDVGHRRKKCQGENLRHNLGGKDGKRKTTKMLKKQPEAQGRPGETQEQEIQQRTEFP